MLKESDEMAGSPPADIKTSYQAVVTGGARPGDGDRRTGQRVVTGGVQYRDGRVGQRSLVMDPHTQLTDFCPDAETLSGTKTVHSTNAPDAG